MSAQDPNQTLSVGQVQRLLAQQVDLINHLGTPAFFVRHSATIPSTYVDAQGISQGDNFPLITHQDSTGQDEQGRTIVVSSASRQDSAQALPRVTGSTVAVYSAESGPRGHELEYAVELNGDGSISGTGSAAGVRLDRTAVINLANYFDNITDSTVMTGAQLDRGMQVLHTSIGTAR